MLFLNYLTIIAICLVIGLKKKKQPPLTSISTITTLQVNSCEVVIVDILVNRGCSLFFHLNCYSFPPGGVIFLVPLWFR